MPTNAHDHDGQGRHDHDQVPQVVDLSEWETDERERQSYDPRAPVPSTATTLWDRWAVAELADGWQVASAVLADGSSMYWLLDPRGQGGGGWCASMAPHELTGSLPREWKQRTGLTCEAKRTNGKPCQQLVKVPGAVCRFHGGDA
jgi:hypothetical protein